MAHPLAITVNIDDERWADIDGCPAGVLARIAGIPDGTSGGLPAVGMGVLLPDGSWVIAQTTFRNLEMAVRFIRTGLEARGIRVDE